MIHKTACITSFNLKALIGVKNRIVNHTTLMCTGIYSSKTNGYNTFFIVPSGSKDGWDEDNHQIEGPQQVKEIISEFDYEDVSNSIDVVFTEFSDS